MLTDVVGALVRGELRPGADASRAQAELAADVADRGVLAKLAVWRALLQLAIAQGDISGFVQMER